MSVNHCIEAGTVFGRWTVIGPERPRSIRSYLCRCDCGNTGTVRKEKLLNGTSRSCGCLQREQLTTHGLTAGAVRQQSREYWIWNSMVQRCTNSKSVGYSNYGGRGITVCDRWRSFENFFADMGPRPTALHSIERRDNDKGYAPDNCHWATRQEQNRNRRNTRWITANGETRCLAQWARSLGCTNGTILARIKLGWPEDRAVTTPVRKFG
jgi:hypothetical protein